jgi:hypothetical protein
MVVQFQIAPKWSAEAEVGFAASIRSIEEQFSKLAFPESLAERFPQLFLCGADGSLDLLPGGGDLLVGYDQLPAAAGTGDLVFTLEPTELFRELMVALACDLKAVIVEVHGWPVLTVQ